MRDKGGLIKRISYINPFMRSPHFLDNETLHAIEIPLTLTKCLFSEQPIQHMLGWLLILHRFTEFMLVYCMGVDF